MKQNLQKKGLKLPWYVGYPILIIAIILSIFLGYKAITGNNVISTMAKVDNSAFLISINKEETIWVGENPFKYFVGHPTKGKSTGSYGCFAGPIVAALRNSGISCTDISGSSIDKIFSYIQQGKPVIIWCRANAADLTQGVTWQYPDGNGEFTELVGEHCAVLIGYDGDYVYLNDPAVGKGVKQPRGKFISNWNKLYNQAIIIN